MTKCHRIQTEGGSGASFTKNTYERKKKKKI